MKKCKMYNISLIKNLKISNSIKKNTTYWAFISGRWKRVAYEYYCSLLSSGIEVISNGSAFTNKVKCLSFTKKKLQCSRFVLNNGSFCFQHAKKSLYYANQQENYINLVNAQKFTKPPKPFLKWVGGKQNLLEDISKKIPKDFNNYYELFLGGGSVLFYVLYLRQQHTIFIKGNIYAFDVNKALINVYCVIQKQSEALYNYLKIYSQQYFNKKSIEEKKNYYLVVRDRYNKIEVTDVEYAAMFIFLNKTCFRGLYRIGPNGFNVPFGNYHNPRINFDKENLMFLSIFIKDVIFKQQPF